MNKLELAAYGLRWSGLGHLLRRAPAWQGILVLNYHRIGDPNATRLDSDLFSASQDGFDAQIAYLKPHCDLIAPGDLDRVREQGRGRHVMITFDDGYRDNHDLALPVLRRHGVPATFFICTGYIDSPALPWWDEIALMLRTTRIDRIPGSEWRPDGVDLGHDRPAAIRAALVHYKALPADRAAQFLDFLRETTGESATQVDPKDLWMSWEMIRTLRSAGMTIGAHTVRHQLLARLSDQEQAIEIRESRDRIAAEVGQVPTAFAYPVGGRNTFTETTKSLLHEHGFESAFSFFGGYQPFAPFDPLEIRRAHVGHLGTQPVYEAMTMLPGIFARW